MSPIQQSPNKYQKTRKREINEQNKIIVRKLESVRPSPQLSMKNLSLRYSTVDLKYKMNLQRSKCINFILLQKISMLTSISKLVDY